MPIRTFFCDGLRAAAISAALLLVAGGCAKKEAAGPAKGSQAIPVDVGTVRVGTVQRSVSVVGTLFGEEDATISNKVNGKIIAIYKDVGDRASPGEPLAQLLRNDYLLSVNQKRSALLESLAKLGVEDVPADDFDITTLPAVRRAKLQAENAENKFNRGKQLFDQKPPLVSQQDFEDLQTSWNVAKSNYDVEVATARGLIGEARTRLADLRVAEQALADTTIRAPYEKYDAPNLDPTTKPGHALAAGTTSSEPGAAPTTSPTTAPTTKPADQRYVIAGRMASIGELFPAVTPMFRIVDDDPLKLKAAVPERYFQELAIGQPVKIRIDAYANEFTGVVTRINPQVDTANRTFPIEVRVPNSEHRLPPGAFARASIDTRVSDGVVFVPAQAVVSFAGNDKVFVIKEGKVQEVQVKLGDRQGDEVEVTEGLKGSETIAVTGTSRLATGIAVQVKPSTQPASQPAMPDTQPSK